MIIQWVINKNLKTHNKKTLEERKDKRERMRNAMYNYSETSEIVVIKSNVEGKHSKAGIESIAELKEENKEKIEYESIVLQRFDFINMSLLHTTTTPTPSELELLLKNIFMSPL